MSRTLGSLLSEERPGVLHFGGARMALLDVEAGFWAIRRQMEALAGPKLTDIVLQQAGANGGASFARAFIAESPVSRGGQAFRDCIAAYQAAGFGRFEVELLEWPRALIRGTDTFEAWASRQHRGLSDAPACAYSAGVLVGFVNALSGRNDIVCVKRACQAQGAEVCLFELLPAGAAGDVPVIAYDPDPALGKQLNLLEILFDRMPMGIVILDQDLRIRRFNPTWAELIEKHTPATTRDLVPGANLFQLAPGIEAAFQPLLESVLSGETVRQEAFRLETGGIVSCWDAVITPLIQDSQVVGIVLVTTDATERRLAEEALRKSEADLRSLMQNAENFAVYRVVIDPSRPHGGQVALASPSINEILGVSDPYRFESWFEHVHPDDLPRVLEANRRAVETGAPYSESTRWYHPVKQEWIWIHTASTPVFDADGHLSHAIGLVLDITEQKRAEEALQESQRRLATLISNLPGMAYRCRNDPGWTMEFVSEGSLDLTGYPPGDLVDNRRVAYGELIHPDDRNLVWEAVQTALKEEQSFQVSYRIVTPGGEKWVWEQGRGVPAPGGEIVALEGFITDITERVGAQRNLEQRVEERTRELSTLLEVSHNVNSTLELEPLLGLILDELENVVGYDGSTILTVEGESLVVRAYRGPIPQDKAIGMRFSVDDPLDRRVLVGRKPVVIRDTRWDSAAAQSFRESVGEHVETTFGHIRSWLGVPLVVKDRVIGQLSLEHGQPDRFSAQHAELVLAFANQAAVAIENARLYLAEQEQLGESEQRRQVAEGLRDILKAINSNQPLDQVLDFIVSQAVQNLGTTAGAIYLLDEEGETLSRCASQGMEDQDLRDQHRVGRGFVGEAVQQRQPAFICDSAVLRLQLHRYAEHHGWSESLQALEQLSLKYGAAMAAPLIGKDDVYGAVVLLCARPREFSEEEVDLALAFADQAALAIENARLRAQAAEAAVAAERNRLARDLHDAVTQTLFSSSLIAEVLPRLWERDPEEGRRRLQELRELSRGALAEMRTLLLELRPSALEESNLGDLLRQLAESITGRARVPVALEVEGECDLEAEVKIALYRIAQEALNNVAKHAGAGEATVRLRYRPGRVGLCVCDDGLGFDPATLPPNSLGLGIMRE
jgi:PAS domain S-box-containing protein